MGVREKLRNAIGRQSETTTSKEILAAAERAYVDAARKAGFLDETIVVTWPFADTPTRTLRVLNVWGKGVDVTASSPPVYESPLYPASLRLIRATTANNIKFSCDFIGRWEVDQILHNLRSQDARYSRHRFSEFKLPRLPRRRQHSRHSA